MADINPTDREQCDPATPDTEDRRVEWAVLAFLLDEHPTQLTILELSRSLNTGPVEFDREDAVERAVRELVGAGLLHCCDGFILPTRAALCFWRLQEAA